jgi:ribosomal protein L40E
MYLHEGASMSSNQPATPGTTGDVYEMLWDCKFCGTTKLLGKTHRFCPSCGAVQDPESRYFPSDEEKVAVKDHHFVGADKTCTACGALNAADAKFCGRCGADLSEAGEVKKVAVRTKAEGDKFDTEDLEARKRAAFEASVGGVKSQKVQAKAKGGIKRWQIILAVVLLFVCGGAAAMMFWTKDATATVTGYRWERTIEVQEMRAQSGKASCGSTPADAYNIDRRYEQVDTKQVADGQTCTNKQVDQGDGTFKTQRDCKTKYRSEAVMGYVCYYKVNRWSDARQVKAGGDKSLPVSWPETNITNTGSCLGCEREAPDGRKETYYLEFKGANKAFECPVPVEQWQNTKLEASFKLKIGAIANDVRCDTLQPAS